MRETRNSLVILGLIMMSKIYEEHIYQQALNERKRMIFDYKKLDKVLGLERWNADLDPKLVGIGHEYDKTVVANNDKIFTGKFKMGNHTIFYPKNLKERLRSNRFATNAKIKVVEQYKDLYERNVILNALSSYKP